MDRPGGTLNHAHGIEAVHTGLGHHVAALGRSVTEETRVVVVGGGAGADAIVAARATVQVDEHGGCAVDDPLLDQEFKQIRGDFSAAGRSPHDPRLPFLFLAERRGLGGGQGQGDFARPLSAENVPLDELRGDEHDVDIADGAACIAAGSDPGRASRAPVRLARRRGRAPGN